MELSEQPLAVKNVCGLALSSMNIDLSANGVNETLHFRTTTFWAQLLLGVGV
jgi:hypothetical protein